MVAEIKRLKDQPGKDIVQYGFGQLSHTLMEHGLLDELRLWVHPLFVGSGGPQDLLFREGPLTRLNSSTPRRSRPASSSCPTSPGRRTPRPSPERAVDGTVTYPDGPSHRASTVAHTRKSVV